jgi:intracellular sulfur oxidation DsrE/DsrF family protein
MAPARASAARRRKEHRQIVTYGPGITVCSNTLKAMNVDRQEIVELVDDFYPGIVRIVELQEKGYVYLRP